MSQHNDRNLLVGILALQADYIRSDQLLAAMNAWALRKDKALEEILFEQQALSAERLKLLKSLVEQFAGATPVSSEGPDSRIDAVCDSFYRAWHNGEQPKIEDYLLQLPSSLRDELLEELLLEELHQREIADEKITPEEYIARFPQQAAIVARAIAPDLSGSDLSSERSRLGRGADRTRRRRRFRVIRPHARGGLGEVFIAQDTELNREVALKEIQSRFASHTESRKRFVMEAEITGSLEHPGIVPVYGLGHHPDGRPFYAMRFIKGDSLKEAIDQFHKRHPRPGHLTTGEVGVEFRKLLGRFVDVCEALEYAHSRGVLHRDLKPGNIMLGKYGETLVVDWGLAKVVAREQHYKEGDEQTVAPGIVPNPSQTEMGRVLGTRDYMSPEQAAGRFEELGTATDIYSLGATLYHLITGRSPFAGVPADEILSRVQRGDFVHPRDNVPQAARTVPEGNAHHPRSLEIPASLEAICLKAMAFKPGDRYPSAAALAADVERFLADEPVTAFPEPLSQRTKRWIRRHNTFVGSTAAAVVVATITLSILAGLLNGKNSELRTANESLKDAATQISEQRDQIAAQNESLEETNHNLQTTNEELVNLNRRLELANEAERLAKEDATTKQALAVQKSEESRRRLYIGRMASIEANWQAGHLDQATELLKKYDDGTPDSDLRGFEWHYWNNRLHSHLWEVQVPEPNDVCSISPDGTIIAGVGTQTGTVRLWSVATGEEIALLRGDFGEPPRKIGVPAPQPVAARDLVFSPDGSHLAVNYHDGTLSVWEVRGQTRIDKFRGTAARFSPNGSLLTYTIDARNRLWNVAQSSDSDLSTEDLIACEFQPDGTRLILLFRTGEVRLRNMADGTSTVLLRDVSGRAHMALSADGSRLAVADEPMRVRVVDVNTQQVVATASGPLAATESIRLNHDGSYLLTESRRQNNEGERSRISISFSLWNVRDTTVKATTEIESALGEQLLFDEKLNRMLFLKHNEARCYDLTSGQEIYSHNFPQSSYKQTGFLNRDTMKVGYNDEGRGVITIIETIFDTVLYQYIDVKGEVLFGERTEIVQRDFSEFLGDPKHFSFTPDGSRLLVDDGGALRLRDSVRRSLERIDGCFVATALTFSPDGRSLACSHPDTANGLRFIETESMHTRMRCKGTSGVASVVFTHDGSQIAITDSGTGVQIRDVVTGTELAHLRVAVGTPECVAYSPDDQLLAVGYDNGAIGMWHQQDGWHCRMLPAHQSNVTGLSFHPTRNLLASTSGDGTVKLWNTTTKELDAVLKETQAHMSCVKFSPNGCFLAAVGASPGLDVQEPRGDLTIWDSETRRPLFSDSGLRGWRNSIAFSPDSTRLAFIHGDQIQLLDLSLSEIASTVNRKITRNNPPSAIAFHPSGDRLAALSCGQEVELFDARPWTPELRVQQQARCLVDSVLPKSATREDLLAAIRGNRTFSDAARSVALEMASAAWNSHARKARETAAWYLAADSRSVVEESGSAPEDYRRALRNVEQAACVLPDRSDILTTLGAAQFRVGQFKDALETLELSRKLDERYPWTPGTSLAFLALTHHRLGHATKVREALDLFGKRSKGATSREPFDVWNSASFRREIEQLFDEYQVDKGMLFR